MKLRSQTPSAELINEALDAVKNTETTSTVEAGGHTLPELRTVIKVVQELRAKVQEVLAAAAARSDKAPTQHSDAEKAPISNVRSQVALSEQNNVHFPRRHLNDRGNGAFLKSWWSQRRVTIGPSPGSR